MCGSSIFRERQVVSKGDNRLLLSFPLGIAISLWNHGKHKVLDEQSHQAESGTVDGRKRFIPRSSPV